MLFLRRAHSPFIKNMSKNQQQRYEHIIRKNRQIKCTVHDENKKMKYTKTKHEKKSIFTNQ